MSTLNFSFSIFIFYFGLTCLGSYTAIRLIAPFQFFPSACYWSNSQLSRAFGQNVSCVITAPVLGENAWCEPVKLWWLKTLISTNTGSTVLLAVFFRYHLVVTVLLSVYFLLQNLHYSPSPKKNRFIFDILGFDNEVVGLVPVGQQVGGLLVVHAHVEIREHPWEEVVNLSGNIQDVTHSATNTITRHVSPLLLISLTVTQHMRKWICFTWRIRLNICQHCCADYITNWKSRRDICLCFLQVNLIWFYSSPAKAWDVRLKYVMHDVNAHVLLTTALTHCISHFSMQDPPSQRILLFELIPACQDFNLDWFFFKCIIPIL